MSEKWIESKEETNGKKKPYEFILGLNQSERRCHQDYMRTKMDPYRTRKFKTLESSVAALRPVYKAISTSLEVHRSAHSRTWVFHIFWIFRTSAPSFFFENIFFHISYWSKCISNSWVPCQLGRNSQFLRNPDRILVFFFCKQLIINNIAIRIKIGLKHSRTRSDPPDWADTTDWESSGRQRKCLYKTENQRYFAVLFPQRMASFMTILFVNLSFQSC